MFVFTTSHLFAEKNEGNRVHPSRSWSEIHEGK